MNYRVFLTIIVLSLALASCGGATGNNTASTGTGTAAVAPVTGPGGEITYQLEVTGAGFVPAKLQATVGKPVKLVVTRKTDKTCATEIVIKEYGINQKLPLNQAVEVSFTPTKPGKVRFACAMDMIAGEIEVK